MIFDSQKNNKSAIKFNICGNYASPLDNLTKYSTTIYDIIISYGQQKKTKTTHYNRQRDYN